MHVQVISVGKLKASPERTLIEDYADRYRKTGSGIALRSLKLVEVAGGDGMNAEGERLLKAIPQGAKVLRLDEHGKAWPSTAFATQIGYWRDDGIAELCFLIGGADGYSEAVRSAFPDMLALGPQTWPHRLVRVMLCEQLYRAASLLAGLPYHKA